MITVDVPESISRARLAEMLALIGITDLVNVSHVAVDPSGIRVTTWALHPDHGKRYIPAGHTYPASCIVHIPIVG